MTLQTDQTVRLCARDWIAIVTITVTIAGTLLATFLNHDRLLTQLVTQQEITNKRLDKIEHKLER